MIHTIKGLFMYKFVGATKEIDTSVKEWISKQIGYCNRISDMPKEYSNLKV